MSTRTPVRKPVLATPELDAAIEAARARTIVMWRGERLPLERVPERIAHIDDRDARDRLYGSLADALEVLNPLYAERLDAWRAAGDVVSLAAEQAGLHPTRLAADLVRFNLNAETPYFAALRRYLALVGIEQGDATEADLWHISRGISWASWFGRRETHRAVEAVGRPAIDDVGTDGWRAAENQLAGVTPLDAPYGKTVVAEAYRTLVGSPEWLRDEMAMADEEVPAFVDFVTFVRLWRLRRDVALLTYEHRLYATDDPGMQRAYYSGIVGHATGVAIAEAGYLEAVGPHPFASAERLRDAIAGAMLVETLEQRHGLRWWRDSASAQLLEAVSSGSSADDVLAELGYDGLDWRPVLRQIRTRLIGEMSGYGGPNITTRAGTRKV